MSVYPHIISCFFSVLSGFLIYVTLVFIKQRWANTLHHLMTYMMLPPISFVITKMISNNFALSLGMIGALSIVRFRNPVKNPLELVIFFALVTLGITYGVSQLWAFGLTIVIITILIGSKILEFFLRKINFFPMSLSFNEEFYGNYLEVVSRGKIDELETSDKLSYYNRETDEKKQIKYVYKLLIRDKEEIKNFKEKLEKIDEIVSIEIKAFNK